MWFHLWLLFNGCESVSDLSWLFIQQELLLFALPHNLTVVKMIFVPQTAANVPIPLHSCLQKVYRGKAGVTFTFYMKILFIICVHDDFIKPSFQHFDNFLLEENCQIPYQFFFLWCFWLIIPCEIHLHPNILGIPGWMIFFCLLDCAALGFF